MRGVNLCGARTEFPNEPPANYLQGATASSAAATTTATATMAAMSPPSGVLAFQTSHPPVTSGSQRPATGNASATAAMATTAATSLPPPGRHGRDGRRGHNCGHGHDGGHEPPVRRGSDVATVAACPKPSRDSAGFPNKPTTRCLRPPRPPPVAGERLSRSNVRSDEGGTDPRTPPQRNQKKERPTSSGTRCGRGNTRPSRPAPQRCPRRDDRASDRRRRRRTATVIPGRPASSSRCRREAVTVRRSVR